MDKMFERIFGRVVEENTNTSGEFFQNRKPKKNGTIKALVIVVILFIIAEYVTLTAINLRSPDFIFLVAVFVFIFVALRSLFNVAFDKANKILMAFASLLVVYVLGGQLISSAVFNAGSYQKQLDMDKTADFYKDNPKINFQSIPVVDRDSAERLGDRKMGEMVDYVSQFEVDSEYGQINYKDNPYRVTTLSYADLIKWFTNQGEGLPAYIRVNMVTQESEVVQLKEGMKYSHSDLFFRNINRHIRMNYPTLMFDNPSFEIDEEGDPYWIAPVYNYKIGLFGGKDITGAVIVNAVTGESNYYDIKDVPTWIDRVYPSDLLLSQLNNWGKYTNGYFNTLFSQKGVLKPTDGYNYIAMDDDVYIYTGLTSVSSDASNVGFALINMRTKEAKYYAISGAEEYSAMSSAEGKVQNLQYKATFPILINAGGQPTYFLSLKDGAGLVKKYAFVSVENYQLVAVGDSVADAEKEYYKLLSDNGKVKVDFETKNITAKVTSIEAAVVNGNSNYYFRVEGQDKIFIAPISINSGLPLLKAGDTVTIEYVEDESPNETVSSLKIQ
ncbi:MAG: CvpA family protein [Coprobacillus sp.]